jgi:hypothetical protein
MSKVFYISLMALMMSLLAVGLSTYQFYRFLGQQSASALLRDFLFLGLSYIATALVVAALFVVYRFHEHATWPIVSTCVQFLYLSFLWATVFSFYSDPVRFFESKRAVWEGCDHTEINRQYKCCGFDASARCGPDELPCSRAIAKRLARQLMTEASWQLSLALIHIGAMAALWATHCLGGIEFDQTPQNQPIGNKHEYVQMAQPQ